ncbi:MAG: putative methicillin resistance protein [Cyanobacteria bacterium RYN_339]|nr:putative methicillin resistance protein [Cyanobacteria bacterium RYN_339]
MGAQALPAIHELDDQQWSEDLGRCPGATFFHTGPWLAAVSQAFGTRVERMRFELGRGRWALLPLSIRPLARGLLPLAVAGETGSYGGLVAPEPLVDDEATACFDAVRTRFPNLQVVGNPFAPGPHLPWAATATGVQDESTHLLLVKPLPELRKGFSRGAKARGNKARKLGLTLAVRSDVDAVATFYPLYEDSVRRWGDKLTWPRSRGFFEGLLAHGAPDVHFLFAHEPSGDAVSALLLAGYGPVVHYLAGATRADHLEACPSNFLMEEALARAAAEGRQFFDFGASNGLAGVIQFKESFGATAAPYYSVSRRTMAGRAYFLLRAPVAKLSAWRTTAS